MKPFKFTPRYFPILIIILFCLIMGTVFFVNAAQSDDPVPLPASGDLSSLLPADPAGYRIVYLIPSDSVSSENVLSPDNLMGEVTQALIANKWEEVLNYHADQPIQALIVHGSAYGVVDLVWVAEAWRDGMTVAGVNLPFAEFAELRDYECARQSAKTYQLPFTGNYFFAASQLISAESAEAQAIAEEHELNKCKEDYESPVNVRIQVSYKSGAGPLDTEEDVYRFTRTLLFQMGMITERKQNFENRFAEPTAVPTTVDAENTDN